MASEKFGRCLDGRFDFRMDESEDNLLNKNKDSPVILVWFVCDVFYVTITLFPNNSHKKNGMGTPTEI